MYTQMCVTYMVIACSSCTANFIIAYCGLRISLAHFCLPSHSAPRCVSRSAGKKPRGAFLKQTNHANSNEHRHNGFTHAGTVETSNTTYTTCVYTSATGSYNVDRPLQTNNTTHKHIQQVSNHLRYQIHQTFVAM